MKLELIPNGPINVHFSNGERISLCRCGLTKNAPYCDESHYTYRHGLVGLEIPDKLPRSEDRDWEYQNYLDEQEKIENIMEDCCTGGGNCSCHQ